MSIYTLGVTVSAREACRRRCLPAAIDSTDHALSAVDRDSVYTFRFSRRLLVVRHMYRVIPTQRVWPTGFCCSWSKALHAKELSSRNCQSPIVDLIPALKSFDSFRRLLKTFLCARGIGAFNAWVYYDDAMYFCKISLIF